jgi:hypothetical protein
MAHPFVSRTIRVHQGEVDPASGTTGGGFLLGMRAARISCYHAAMRCLLLLLRLWACGQRCKRLVTVAGLSARLEREGQAAARTTKPMFQGKGSAIRASTSRR